MWESTKTSQSTVRQDRVCCAWLWLFTVFPINHSSKLGRNIKMRINFPRLYFSFKSLFSELTELFSVFFFLFVFFVVRCPRWGFSSTLPPFTGGGGRKSANKYGSEWTGNETGEVNSSQLLPRQQKQHCNGQIIGCGLPGWTSYYILFFSIFLHFFISSLLPLISHLPFFLPYPCSRGRSPSLKDFSSRSSEGKKKI